MKSPIPLILLYLAIITALIFAIYEPTKALDFGAADHFQPLRMVEMPNHSEEQIQIINYAYEISNQNKTFVYLLKAENGNISPQTVHDNGANAVGTDHGLCGISDYYHPEIVNDPRFLSDWQWQVRECYRLFTGGTKFYGLSRIDKVKHFFKFN